MILSSILCIVSCDLEVDLLHCWADKGFLFKECCAAVFETLRIFCLLFLSVFHSLPYFKCMVYTETFLCLTFMMQYNPVNEV